MARLSQEQRRARQVTDRLIADVEAQVHRALRSLQAHVAEAELTRIIRQRDALAMHDLASRLPASLRPALATLRLAFDAGVRLGAIGIPRMSALFTAVDPHAVAYASRYGAQFVAQVTSETRAGIRAIVVRSFTEGIPPREAAKLIKPIIGLTRIQANAVVRFTRALIESGVSRRAASAQAKVYAAKLLRRRALTIARTETIRASAQGQLASWRAATNRGLLQAGAKKVWIVTTDDRLCQRCRPLDGVAVDLDAMFAIGVSAPPLHPSCRCAIAVEPAAIRTRRAA